VIDDRNFNLPDGWCPAKLEELVIDPRADIVDGPFGSNLKASEYRDTGVPIIRIQNVDRNQFINKNIRFISPQKARELNRHNFRAADIVITKLGDPLGKACLVPDGFGPGIIVADIVRFRPQPNLISTSYIVFCHKFIGSCRAACRAHERNDEAQG
jgi:type I restriction enzyme, S subunit